jgi:ESCRT-I complex subunit VPS37
MFKGKKKSSGSSSSQGSLARPKDDAAVLRAKQIDSLRQYFPTVREVSKGERFEVPLTLASRRQIRLVVDLAPDFPRSPPQISLPGESHRLLDAQGRVMPTAHAKLGKWTVHSALGRNVYELVQVFMKDPPSPAQHSAGAGAQQQQQQAPQQSQPRMSSGHAALPQQFEQPPSQSSQQSHSQSQSQQQHRSREMPGGQSWHGGMGSIPSSFPELSHKSAAELQHLLSDESAFQQFFDTLAAVQTMKGVRDDLARANEELARRNIAVEAEIEQLSRKVGQSGDSVDAKKREYEELVRKQQEVMKQFSTPILVERLGDAADEAEEESDAIADEFLSGDIDHKEFVKRFLAERNLFHLRSAKRESLTMMTR